MLARLTAFTTSPEGGNPAGVWIGEAFPDAADMQRIAKEIGFSETAFVTPSSGTERTVRYYSPEAEVPFCGHATIAAGALLGEVDGEGTYRFATRSGVVAVAVHSRNGLVEASLTSVRPRFEVASGELVGETLAALGWELNELDDSITPARAYAGAWHLVLATKTLERLSDLRYEFDALRRLMLREELTTLQLVWREEPFLFHARNPFPVGGVVEDPATGAAAAALGGYLRDAGLIEAPASVTIRQGEAMGRPSLISVTIPREGGIVVSGTAVRI